MASPAPAAGQRAPGGLTAAINAAYMQYCNGGLPRIGYDLSLFDPDARLDNIMDFYTQVIAAGPWSPARREIPDATLPA